MYTENCPYCNSVCDADWCDVGVGMVQCGPFHCVQCGASQIGPYDNTVNPFKKSYINSEDEDEGMGSGVIDMTRKEKEPPRVLTQRESDTGWYEPDTPPGSSANVIGGKVVSHRVMNATYRQEFMGNPKYEDKDYVDEWWDKIRA